jgi:hypothetical protein
MLRSYYAEGTKADRSVLKYVIWVQNFSLGIRCLIDY